MFTNFLYELTSCCQEIEIAIDSLLNNLTIIEIMIKKGRERIGLTEEQVIQLFLFIFNSTCLAQIVLISIFGWPT